MNLNYSFSIKKPIFFLLTSLIFNYLTATQVYLDSSFGSNGSIIQPLNAGAVLYSLQLQSDGKSVFGGSTNVDGSNEALVGRYLTNGTLDTSFAGAGYTALTIGSNDSVYGSAIQSDGKIVITGETNQSGQNYIFVARLNSDGSIDSSFGTSGVTLTHIINDGASGNAVVIQPSNQYIVVGASAVISGTGAMVAARYDTSGNLDSSFGTAGIAVINIGSGCAANAIALQSDGKIILGGHAQIGSLTEYAVVRLNTNGTLDSSFGTGGIVTTQLKPRSTSDIIYAVAVQADGKIVAAGSTTLNTGVTKISLARYTTSGALDTSFGSSGVVNTALGSGSSTSAFAMSLQSNGKIVVGGLVDSSFVVARYNTGGGLDTTFGSSGSVTTSLGLSSEINALAIQSDGKIVTAGFSDNNYALARYLKNNTDYISIANPVNGSTVTSSPLVISGSSSQSSSTVSLSLNSTAIGTTTTDAYGNWSFSDAQLLNGSNSLTVNLLNSSSTVIATATSNFTVSVPNAITISSPTSGSTFLTPIVSLSGYATLASSSVRLTIDGTLYTTITTDSLGHWQTNSATLTNATHTLLVELLVSGVAVANATSTFTVNAPLILPSGYSKLKVIEGVVATNGTIVSGAGFTTSTGLLTLTVNYTAPFTSAPIVVATSEASLLPVVTIASNSTTSTTFNLGSGITNIHFLATQLVP